MKKQSLSVFAMLASTLILITSCGSNESKPEAQANAAAPAPAAEQPKTEQAPVIQTVAIGDMNWMTENLKTTTFSNGEPILEAKTNKEWVSAAKSKTPAYRMSDGVFLYNGYAMKDARGIAPTGFKVASTSDFKSLSKALGGGTSVDGKAAKAMASYTWEIEEWNESTGDLGMMKIKGANSAGFNATKGGFCYESGDVNLGGCSYWWTSDGGSFDIGYCSQDLGGGFAPSMNLGYGFEVRCVKN
jgi:uncharacterized protein (TIGR02145 family)